MTKSCGALRRGIRRARASAVVLLAAAAGALLLAGPSASHPDKGTVVIEKKTVGGDGTFTFSGSGAGIDASFEITTSGGSGSATFADIEPGIKTVTEVGPPPGWTFTSVTCYDPDDGTTVGGQTATIDLDAGETVTCVFENEKPPPPPPPAEKGFMTGGGQFNPEGDCPDPKKDVASFGGNVSGTVGGTDAKGRVNYLNHCTRVHINARVTAILEVIEDEEGRTIEMTFEIVFNGCTATWTWHDTDEPNQGQDWVQLLISDNGCPPDQAIGQVPVHHGNLQGHLGGRDP